MQRAVNGLSHSSTFAPCCKTCISCVLHLLQGSFLIKELKEHWTFQTTWTCIGDLTSLRDAPASPKNATLVKVMMLLITRLSSSGDISLLLGPLQQHTVSNKHGAYSIYDTSKEHTLLNLRSIPSTGQQCSSQRKHNSTPPQHSAAHAGTCVMA